MQVVYAKRGRIVLVIDTNSPVLQALHYQCLGIFLD